MTIARYTDAYYGEGRTLTLAAPYDVTSGAGAKVGAHFGVAKETLASGASGEFETQGEFNLTKVGSQAWAVGELVYWDNSNKRCTTDSAAGMLIGACTVACGSGAGVTSGTLKLSGLPDLAEGAQANIAALTFGTDITAATANGSLTDSSAVNPTKAQFDELAKELGTKINAIVAALVAAGVIDAP